MANLYARSLGYKVEITQKIKKDKEICFLGQALFVALSCGL